MNQRPLIAVAFATLVAVAPVHAQQPAVSQTAESPNPADKLPANIRQITWFGERADWSHDGARILFLSKTFGDALEIDLATGHIRNLTARYPHCGYTRALYLADGNILLSGPREFDPAHAGDARIQCWLSVLDKNLASPPTPLDVKCSEGPAVSRSRMHIAWAQIAAEYPDELARDASRIDEADIVRGADGRFTLQNKRRVLASEELPFRCTLEPQSYRPPAETELTFSAYGHQGTDVCGVELATKRITNYSNAPDQYDEPEGIFPDGQFTLVECDAQNHAGSGHVDMWKLALDGSGRKERLTFFSDAPGYKASNAVISDDGRCMAFQLAKSTEAAGVGHGLFVMELAAPTAQ